MRQHRLHVEGAVTVQGRSYRGDQILWLLDQDVHGWHYGPGGSYIKVVADGRPHTFAFWTALEQTLSFVRACTARWERQAGGRRTR